MAGSILDSVDGRKNNQISKGQTLIHFFLNLLSLLFLCKKKKKVSKLLSSSLSLFYLFPQVVQTSLRPDIVLWSEDTKKIILIELTVPWEDGCEEASERKTTKYLNLVQQCRDKGGQTWLFPVEVGCRGFPAQSVWRMLTALGIAGRERKTAARRLGEAAERASCWLWNRREDLSWKPGEWWAVTGYHCRPANWRTLWFRVKPSKGGWKPPDDIFSWLTSKVTEGENILMYVSDSVALTCWNDITWGRLDQL